MQKTTVPFLKGNIPSIALLKTLLDLILRAHSQLLPVNPLKAGNLDYLLSTFLLHKLLLTFHSQPEPT